MTNNTSRIIITLTCVFSGLFPVNQLTKVAFGPDPPKAAESIPSPPADDIESFFSREMAQSGWTPIPPFQRRALFFRKGKIEIVVAINDAGGTFSLMGS